jgi:hypothetical protein
LSWLASPLVEIYGGQNNFNIEMHVAMLRIYSRNEVLANTRRAILYSKTNEARGKVAHLHEIWLVATLRNLARTISKLSQPPRVSNVSNILMMF